MYNASLNIAIGEYILGCFPEASVQRSERGTFEKIESVQDGILYTFKESGKTGRVNHPRQKSRVTIINFMKRILIILLASLPFLELSAQDRNEPFTDFLSWKETYLFGLHAGDTLVLSSKPGNEVYFLSLEGPRFLMEADMDALNEDIPGLIVPQYARQWLRPDKDENAKNYIYEWESPILAIERDFTGPIPEDIKEYPFRKNGNGKGVWDLLMVAARLRRGGDLSDLISSTVMFCGKQHYISAIRTALVFVGDEKATQYTVYFDQKTHVKITYESKGYHRPLTFDLRFGDMKIKGKLIEQ